MYEIEKTNKLWLKDFQFIGLIEFNTLFEIFMLKLFLENSFWLVYNIIDDFVSYIALAF